MRDSKEEDYIIPNGWQRLPDTHITDPEIKTLLEMAFSQNEKYREAFHSGLLTIIKKGWVRVPINQSNSAKFKPIFVEHHTLGNEETKADLPQIFTEIKSSAM